MGKAVKNHTLILSLLLVLVVSVFIPFIISSPKPKPRRSQLQHTSSAQIFGVKIQKNPPPSMLANLRVTSWPRWGCPPSKFPWAFKATETIYLLEGKVNISVDGYEGSFEIRAGDLVVFPKGMQITWDVIESVNKHYSLEK